MDIMIKVITLKPYIESADFTFVPCLETFLYTFLVFSEPYVGGGGVVSFTSGLYRMQPTVGPQHHQGSTVVCVSAHWSSCDMISAGNITIMKRSHWFIWSLSNEEIIVRNYLQKITSSEQDWGVSWGFMCVQFFHATYFKRAGSECIFHDRNILSNICNRCMIDFQFI